ncbi:MAG: hypothetical protein P8Z74_16275 [Acidobacteriota bacterium]
MSRGGEESWKIERLQYRVLSRADYRPGKSHTGSISVRFLSEAYPRDPAGPDIVVGQT